MNRSAWTGVQRFRRHRTRPILQVADVDTLVLVGIATDVAVESTARAASDLQYRTIVTHLHFTGHFTGSFVGKAGEGQRVDFIATDIYRVSDGRIAEDWHLEDNLTFLQQIGFVAR